MYSLEKKLIELMQPALNPEVTLNLLALTPEPQISLQMLLGLYVSNVAAKYQGNDYSDIIEESIVFNHYTQKVSFTYKKPERVGINVLKEHKEAVITNENWNDYSVKYDYPNTITVYYNTGIIIEKSETIPFSVWGLNTKH